METAQKLMPEIETQQAARTWFESLRDQICAAFEEIEDDYTGAAHADIAPGRFTLTPWDRAEGGAGVMGMMKGRVFEKVGVNVSTVYGAFSPEFAKQIPGAEENPNFFATGISLVAHMRSPRVPAAHFNTRFIVTTKSWFGGGGDLNPTIAPVSEEVDMFHAAYKTACDKYDAAFYPKYKQWCDEYFFIKHRNMPRGAGGIFYDYHNTGNWDVDFAFTQDVGRAFLETYPTIIRRRMNEAWTPEERELQLISRGRYAEFNLVYDRGTMFGLKTGGNADAILMSLPPEAKWP
jgi:coproporphyrinogen III oxidase